MDSVNPFFSKPKAHHLLFTTVIISGLYCTIYLVSLINLTLKFEILRFFPKVDLNCKILSI